MLKNIINLSILSAVLMLPSACSKPLTREEVQLKDNSNSSPEFVSADDSNGFLVNSLGPIKKTATDQRNCYYNSPESRPQAAFVATNRYVLGVASDKTGLIYGMIPNTALQESLDLVKTDEVAWKTLLVDSDIKDYKAVIPSNGDQTALDMQLKKRSHVTFILFPNSWFFRDDKKAFTLKDSVEPYASPFTVGNPTPNHKMLHVQYYRGDAIPKDCRYSFSLNVNSSNQVLNTYLEIDPIINNDGTEN